MRQLETNNEQNVIDISVRSDGPRCIMMDVYATCWLLASEK